ncbi:MAG: hypothetical protein JXD21_03460 [Candidatus Omnitrophica bacterium]|nr:hypothetical protein [Candidatus Omnitrophota bacterium]
MERVLETPKKINQEFLVEHPRFVTQKLVVRPAEIFRGPRLVLNGEVQPEIEGKFTVTDDIGKETVVRLLYNIVDPVPIIEIDGDQISLVKPFLWYQRVWVGLPLLLIFVGKLFGALLGIVAVLVNIRVFRSDKPLIIRYLRIAWVNIMMALVYFVLASSFMMFINLLRLK